MEAGGGVKIKTEMMYLLQYNNTDFSRNLSTLVKYLLIGQMALDSHITTYCPYLNAK